MSESFESSASDWRIRAARRRRKLWTILGVLAGAGFIAGFLSGFNEGETSIFQGGPLPPWIALAAAGLTLAALTIGCWIYFRMSDELDRQINLQAASAAAYVSMAGYPAWFMLARGGWTGEPDPFILFAATTAVYTGVYCWKKYL